MRIYLGVTGTIFALIVCAHAARVVLEGVYLLSDPVFLALTVAAACMSGWAWYLFLVTLRRNGKAGRSG